ncbi:MAG: type II toxin-antitoxin system prevent-host-death family antitoxin [Mycobacterium sp.]
MAVIPQKELRNNVADVLRRAESGEQITVTVAGRPVAQLGPTPGRQWICGPALREVWTSAAPRTLEVALEDFASDVTDPFA